ncbi:MAG TPA: PEP/pyruvate-binding domain-containing protein [Desulfomonilaceae bacterium]|nr:PEP/pyruvate-binding domain-containing protein [Desulfomonilaceae bacterium]
MWSGVKELADRFFSRKRDLVAFPQVFEQFQALLHNHQRAMELIADLGEKSGGDYIFDRKYLSDTVHELQDLLLRMVKGLNLISSNRYYELYDSLDRVFLPMETELRGRLPLADAPYTIPLQDAPLDNPELIGGKAGTLAEIANKILISVPTGFVITAKAYHRYLAYNDLEERIHSKLEAWISGKEELSQAASQIRYSILAGIIPQDLARQIMKYAQRTSTSWAVRSSAYGEDGDLSFAGLHETVLNVLPEQVPEAYKKVLASLYSPEALTYRLRMGMMGEETAMAVLCQEMIPSQASGVIQTANVEESEPGHLVIYASFGLGRTVVEGKSSPDRYVVEKHSPFRIGSRTVARKQMSVRSVKGGGEEEIPLDEHLQTESSISEKTINSLVKWALTLERYFKRPQEIEWAVDGNGNCWILQSRRLVIPASNEENAEDICESCSAYTVLVKDRGVVAHTGVGCGRVYTVHSNEDMKNFPEGAVLVTRFTAPWLAQVVPKAAAIIAERGSAAGHLATIAREFRVPALVSVDGVTEILHDGMEITLDTPHRVIYAGQVKELLRYEYLQSMVFEESPEFRLLRRLLKRIAQLHLVDPQSSEFVPRGCTSVHDLIRFIHEKAVQELMDLPRFLRRFKGTKVWTLVSDVPIGLRILDLGDGIAPETTGDKVRINQIESLPLRALWEGISLQDVWSTEPIDVDFRGLMASLTRSWDAAGAGVSAAGINLAVVSKMYLNLHLRLGYHYNLIDARMHDDPQHNHIYFRFVGGVTDITRRSRRAQVLAQILSSYHFNAITKGDLVVARLLHLAKEEIQERLKVIGALIGFTRQLDIRLRTDHDIPKFVEEFFNRHAHLAQSLM